MRTGQLAATLERTLRFAEDCLLCVAGLVMLAMMALTTVDVLMRYAFNTPLSWAFDLLTHYLLVASFFFAFSAALRLGDHVAVDFFAPKFPPAVRAWILAAAWLTCSGIMSVIAYSALHESWRAWAAGEVIAGTIPWPVWPAKALVALGLAPMALRLLSLALGCALSGAAPLPGSAADAQGMGVRA